MPGASGGLERWCAAVDLVTRLARGQERYTGLPLYSLRHRIALLGDIPALLELLARPGDGYGPSSLVGLGPLLERLLSARALRGPVLENRRADSGGRGPMLGAALTGFVELAQARALLAAPPAHLVDHLLARESAGEELLLRPERLAALNAGEGTAIVFVAFRLAMPPEEASTVIASMFESFRLFHAGYYCPLALHPPGNSARGDESLRGLGFRPIGEHGRIWLLESATLDKAPFNPFIVLQRGPPPRLRFSHSEKDFLLYALLGCGDAEIARELSISRETVKKRWRSVFERVAERSELSIFPHTEADETKRGPEKRGALLEYLNAHLEELRPYAPARAAAPEHPLPELELKERATE